MDGSQKILDKWREICSSKVSSVEETPFGPEALVYKVSGKMFALIGLKPPLTMNLKCDPERAIELREEHIGIIPGYHMNKQHWNTVYTNGSVPLKLVRELIDHSYDLVLKSLPKAKREALE